MPDLFLDLCLYSEVSAILSTYSYHLPARRFIQELFQDIKFDKVGHRITAGNGKRSVYLTDNT